MLEKIKLFYKKHLYTKGQVHKFLEKGIITKEEYKEIVGEMND